MEFQTSSFLGYSLHHLHDLVIWIGKDGKILNGNASALSYYGYDRESFCALNIYDLDSNFGHAEWDQHWEALKRNGVLTVTVQHRNASGQYLPVEIVDTYQCFEGNEFSLAVIRQIDHRDDRSQRMQLMEFSVDQMRDTTLWIDKEARILYANDAACRNLGYTHDELVKLAIYDIDPHFPKDNWAQHWLDLQQNKSLTFETEQRHKNGRLVPVEVNANLVQGYEEEFNCAFIRDITERKSQQDELVYMANHDALTSLPNRSLMNERLSHSIESARKNQSYVGVLVIDLDKFKLVNDTFGHEAGDELLTIMSKRMLNMLRDRDTVARVGGDEFVIVLDDMSEPAHCALICGKLQEVLSQPVKIGEHDLASAASIGVAVWPNDGDDAVTLLKHADIAMYRAKAAGRGVFKFYEEKMGRALTLQLELINGLERALEHNELELFYQPIFDLNSEVLIGAEALLYWRDPVHGLVSPMSFISAAEESGLILPIGEWVIGEACRQNMKWSQSDKPAFPIAVNLSSREFYSQKILQTVDQALLHSELPPELLRIEVTESSLMDHPQQAIWILNALHEMGLTISIDDFGTGYSSLRYLEKFPIDFIHIDLSFIKDIGVAGYQPIIANTIIGLSHNMGFKVVAEGVETELQRDHLRAEGCDYVQGFLYGNPVPADLFESLYMADDFLEKINARLARTT